MRALDSSKLKYFFRRLSDPNDIKIIEETVACMDEVWYGGVRQSSTAAVLSKASIKASADPGNPLPKKRKHEEEMAKLQREAGNVATFLWGRTFPILTD